MQYKHVRTFGRVLNARGHLLLTKNDAGVTLVLEDLKIKIEPLSGQLLVLSCRTPTLVYLSSGILEFCYKQGESLG